MDLKEVRPFLFIVSSSSESSEYTEVSLDDFEVLLSAPVEDEVLTSELDSLLESFPHKNYIPFSHIEKSSGFNRSSLTLLQSLICCKGLIPIFNKSGLCFLFSKKTKLAKLSEILKENSYNMSGEIIKIATDVKLGRIGEDLTVNLTNGTEKIFKNTSENYLKTISRKPKKKTTSFCILSRQPTFKVLRDMSNSGN
jgi:hypothetical protein